TIHFHLVITTLSLHDALPIWAHNPKVTGSSPVPATTLKETIQMSVVSFFISRGMIMAEFVVYILYSKGYDKKYIGYTSNLVERRSEEHTSELQSRFDFVCRLL